MDKQIALFDGGVENLCLESTITQDAITDEVSKIFDYTFEGTIKEEISIPSFPDEFDIGIIVGSSGSGKSTILSKSFTIEEEPKWDNSKAIVSHFDNFEDASKKFGAVGLNSIPTWLKPFRVLSNGEKFRANMARMLKDGAAIDEFTSVVNRDVAVSCSISIEKYIRSNGIKNVVFSSCHDDIIPYLRPDWVYNTDTHEFYTGRYLQRPEIKIELYKSDKSAWSLFKKYHYLSADLNGAATCYVGLYKGRPVCFASLLTLPGRDVKHAWREHRMVVLPDFQGMGIGNKLSEALGQYYIEMGCQYFCKTSNPRMGEHRDKSPKWRPTANNHHDRPSYLDEDGNVRGTSWNSRYGMQQDLVKYHAKRVCYSHEYIGDGTVYPYTYNGGEKTEADDDGYVKVTLF